MLLHLLLQILCSVFIQTVFLCFSFINVANLACIWRFNFNECFNIHNLKYLYQHGSVSTLALIFFSLWPSKANILSRSCSTRHFKALYYMVLCWPVQWVKLHVVFHQGFALTVGGRTEEGKRAGKCTDFPSHGLCDALDVFCWGRILSELCFLPSLHRDTSASFPLSHHADNSPQNWNRSPKTVSAAAALWRVLTEEFPLGSSWEWSWHLRETR